MSFSWSLARPIVSCLTRHCRRRRCRSVAYRAAGNGMAFVGSRWRFQRGGAWPSGWCFEMTWLIFEASRSSIDVVAPMVVIRFFFVGLRHCPVPNLPSQKRTCRAHLQGPKGLIDSNRKKQIARVLAFTRPLQKDRGPFKNLPRNSDLGGPHHGHYTFLLAAARGGLLLNFSAPSRAAERWSSCFWTSQSTVAVPWKVPLYLKVRFMGLSVL